MTNRIVATSIPKGLSRRTFLAGIASSGIAPAIRSYSAPARATSGWDFVVIGAGVFGSWTAWTLQRRGYEVLLLDAWGPAHSRSSSGGETRLIRTEYAGNALYSRWAWESYAQWRALAARQQTSLFWETGALYFYPEDTADLDRSIALQRLLGIPIEKVGAAELARRWPQIDFAGISTGILQPTMGALMARRSVQAIATEFQQAGGSFRQFAVDPPDEAMDAMKFVSGGSERIDGGQFIFACGPWLPRLFPETVGGRIGPSRQAVFYFAPGPGDHRFRHDTLPAWVDVSSPDLHYGFPDIESRGFKIALDRHGPRFDLDNDDRVIGTQELCEVRSYLSRRFPDLADRPLAESRVCQYENSDNGHFLIDCHPRWPNCWIVGGGTGHGFKHGPAVGKYVADLVLGVGAVEQDLRLAAHTEHA